jgi:hypothetical protein
MRRSGVGPALSGTLERIDEALLRSLTSLCGWATVTSRAREILHVSLLARQNHQIAAANGLLALKAVLAGPTII